MYVPAVSPPSFVCGHVARPECQTCGLFKGAGKPFIPPVVENPSKPIDLVVVGEAPGAREDEAGQYFVGPAGKLLDDMVDASDWRERNLAFFNSVQCWPGRGPDGDAKPSMEQVRCCRPLLLENLKRANPGAILAMGQWAARSLADDGRCTIGGKYPTRLRSLPIPDWDDPPYTTVTYHPAAVFHQAGGKGLALRQAIEEDLNNLLTTLSWEDEALPEVVRLTPDLLRLHTGYVAFDAEFNGAGNDLYSIAIYDGATLRAAPVQRLDAEYDPSEWREALSAWLSHPRLTLVGHNVNADLAALGRFGVRLPKFVRLHDTLTLCRMQWENDPERTLETMARAKLNMDDYAEAIRPFKKKNPNDFGAVAPLDVLLAYNAGDTYASWRLMEQAKTKQLPQALLALLNRAQYHLFLAHWDGQQISPEALKEIQRKYQREVRKQLKTLAKITGQPKYNPRTDEGKSFPWKVLRWTPLSHGKEGPSLDEHTLLHFKATTKGRSQDYATAMLDFRKAVARLDRLNHDFTENQDANGRVHAYFNTAAAVTLRDSAKQPNYQSVTSELRSIIISRWKGGRITHADLKGLEPRIMAHVTGCQLLLEIFQDKQRAGKIYEILGEEILGRKISKADKEGRKTIDYRLAKEVILATNYNAIAYTLCQRVFDQIGLVISELEAKRWIDRYLAMAPELKNYMWDQRRLVLRDQAVTCQTGFVRHLPNEGAGDYRGTPQQKAQASAFKHAWNQAVNVDIQHTASMIGKLWSLYIQALLDRDGLLERTLDNRAADVVYLGPVHDSVSHDARTVTIAKKVIEVYPKALSLIQGDPIQTLIGETLQVPLDCDVDMGLSWRFD
jgi:uracil-DNA glycosylase family 4